MHPATRITLGTLATVFAIHAGPARAAPEITICHMPQDDPRTVQTIRVSIHDWPDHEAHGDALDACQAVFDSAAPPRGEDGSLDAGAPASGDGDPAAVGNGDFEAVLCDDRSGDHGRLIEVNETGRISVRAAKCG